MQNSLIIKAQSNLRQIESMLLDIISPESVEFIYSENFETSGNKKYYVCLKGRNELPREAVSSCLADWILNKYELQLMSDILIDGFAEFTKSERYKILEIAENKAELYNQIYNHRYIVKKISSYLENQNCISIDGFLKFRLAEYRRELEMLLCEAVEEFCAEKEYVEFINLIKDYINSGESLIDLVHVKDNADGTYSFYDFKKDEISLMVDDESILKELFSEEDKVMSILISVIPKRVIWHNESQIHDNNLITTIKEIFKDRFTICHGCELCNPK